MSERFGLGESDGEIRLKLSRVLHSRPISIVFGAASGTLVGLITLLLAHSAHLQWAALALIGVAVTRPISAYGSKYLHNRIGRFLRRTFLLGALIYAAVTGVCAGLAMLLSDNAHLQLLVVGFALIFGAGIAVGNAGRPMISLGQMVLIFLPIMIASLMLGSVAMMGLAIILPCLGFSLAIMTLNISDTLVSQEKSSQSNKQLALQMRELAQTDAVTGLANRTGFQAAAQELLESASPGQHVALFWLDLHRLKEVNDMLGHQAGDQVLVHVADRLKQRLPEDAIVSRFGSDEFLLLARFPDRFRMDQLASQISSDLAHPFRINGQRIETGASIGICLWDAETRNLEALMQRADLALYHAKVAGRHHISIFNPTMTRNLVRRREIEAELRSAIQKDELSIYFQPIVDLASGKIRAFEALVRWFHPEKGELVPEEFIPVAEESGLIITLGNWITRNAAKAAAHWPEDVMLCVNLSPVQIRAPGSALGILSAIRDAQIDPSRLELEVTENLFIKDDEETARFMEELAAEGVRFALDDFGTGYSSLHYINKYPFRTIKVDRSFVSGPKIGRRSDAIIRAVAEMGSTLDMEIVAEGLETASQVQTVREAGCTLGQGYHFSRAVPQHLAIRLLEEERAAESETRRAG